MEAYVTLVATDTYTPGALILAHRLRDLGTTKQLACLVTPNVSANARTCLAQCFHRLIDVASMTSTRPDNLVLLGRPELGITLTKLHVFRLFQFSKVVFLDADTFPIKLIDELFERPSFSAAPDVGWPDCFNSGVFVTVPSGQIYDDLIQLAADKGSFDGGDQGLLNTYFSSWPESSAHRLPFTYNTTPSAAYSYAPAYMEFRDSISVAHFIGTHKPWHYQRFADGTVHNCANDHVQLWWDTWDKHYDKISPQALLSTQQPSAHQDKAPKKETVEPIWLSISRAASTDNLSSYRPLKMKAHPPPPSPKQLGDPKMHDQPPTKTIAAPSDAGSTSQVITPIRGPVAGTTRTHDESRHIFSQATSVAEATMLEFELEYNERCR